MVSPQENTSEELPEDEPDFAEEHSELEVDEGDRGGPEGVAEPESPRGYGGMDLDQADRSND